MMNVYIGSPIDDFNNAEIVPEFLGDVFLTLMNEPPRFNDVFRILLPSDSSLLPAYICKADNNGTVYIFTEANIDSSEFTKYQPDPDAERIAWVTMNGLLDFDNYDKSVGLIKYSELVLRLYKHLKGSVKL